MRRFVELICPDVRSHVSDVDYVRQPRISNATLEPVHEHVFNTHLGWKYVQEAEAFFLLPIYLNIEETPCGGSLPPPHQSHANSALKFAFSGCPGNVQNIKGKYK